MSSSDSDDCYGNAALHLQRLKDRYEGVKVTVQDKIETLINDSAEFEVQDIVTDKENDPEPVPDVDLPCPFKSLDDFPVPKERGRGRGRRARGARGARTSGRKSNRTSTDQPSGPSDAQNATPSSPSSKRGRRNKKQLSLPELPDYDTEEAPTMSARSRGRGKRKQNPSRTPRRRPFSWSMFYRAPISNDYNMSHADMTNVISVGNTAEYPDMSHSQPLFGAPTKPTTEAGQTADTKTEELNPNDEELSVKVYWQSREIFKFSIRRFQNLTEIFDYFSNKENVAFDRLLFTYNDKILKPEDTPDVIDYNIAKFIDGGVVQQSVSLLQKSVHGKDSSGVQIKFQFQNVKKLFEVRINLDEKIKVAMMKCAKHLDKSLNSLKFFFDGDSILEQQTGRDLEFEGGECIDVKLVS